MVGGGGVASRSLEGGRVRFFLKGETDVRSGLNTETERDCRGRLADGFWGGDGRMYRPRGAAALDRCGGHPEIESMQRMVEGVDVAKSQ